jgi:hypothetical protein
MLANPILIISEAFHYFRDDRGLSALRKFLAVCFRINVAPDTSLYLYLQIEVSRNQGLFLNEF